MMYYKVIMRKRRKSMEPPNAEQKKPQDAWEIVSGRSNGYNQGEKQKEGYAFDKPGTYR